jgi:hypothetical protein
MEQRVRFVDEHLERLAYLGHALRALLMSALPTLMITLGEMQF